MTDNPQNDEKLNEQAKVKEYFGSIYQNAVKKLGAVSDVQNKAIISKINKEAFGVAYNEPLWDMPLKKTEAIANRTVTAEYSEQPTYTAPTAPTAQFNAPVAQEQQTTGIENIQKTPVVADKQTLPKFTYHDPNGKDYELQAVGVDKYGEYIWKNQKKGQGLLEEFTNWTLQLHTNNLYKDYIAQKNARENAVYALQNVEQQRQDQLKAQGVTAKVESVVDPTEKQINDKMIIDKFQNFAASVGRQLMTGLEIGLGTAAYGLERVVGTAMLKSGLYNVDGWDLIDQNGKRTNERGALPSNITWDEAWQASRLTFDVFGKTNYAMSEYIRRYRENPDADPAELQREFEDPIRDAVLSAAADPWNVLDRVTAANKAISALDKAKKFSPVGELATKLDNVESALRGAENVAEAVPVSVVDNIDDAVRVQDEVAQVVDDVTEIRTIDANLPVEQQIPTAQQNYKLAKEQWSQASKAKKAIDKVADAEGFQKADAAAKEAKKTMLNWKDNVDTMAAQVENNKRMAAVDDMIKSVNKTADGKKSKIPSPHVLAVENAVDDLVASVNKRVQEIDQVLIKKGRMLRDTQMKKVAEVGDTVKDTMTLIMAGSDDSKQFGRTIASMMVVIDPNASVASKRIAIQNILSHPAKATILSDGAMQTAVVLREMFTEAGGGLNQTALGKIMEAANAADDPLLELAQQLDKRAYAVVNKMFPDIYTRIDNIEKINELKAAGKPIPSYLKRYMDGDVAETISPFYKKMAEAHRTVQDKLGYRFINKMMVGSYITLNPPAWCRNATSGMSTMATDGINPFRGKANIEKVLTKWGAPSTTEVAMAGVQSAVPTGKDVEITAKGPVKKILDFFKNANSDIEQFQAKQIVAHSLETAMKDQFKVIYRDLEPQLINAGFTKDEIAKLTANIYESGSVRGGFEMTFDMAKHRNISDFISADDIAKLDAYIPRDQISDALRGAKNKADAKTKIKRMFDELKKFGDNALKEEAVIDPESSYFDEFKDVHELPEEYVEKYDVDVMGRKVIATQQTFAEARKTISAYKRNLREVISNIRYDLDTNAQRMLDQQFNAATKVFDDAEAAFNKYLVDQSTWRQTEGADILRRAKLAEKSGDREMAGMLYNEFKAMREEMWTKTGTSQIAAFRDALGQAQNIMADYADTVPAPSMKRFEEFAGRIDLLNDVDLDAYRISDDLISKSTGEKLPFNVMGDSYATGARSVNEAQSGLDAMFDKLINRIDADFDNVKAPNIDDAKTAALKEFMPIAEARLSEARGKAFEIANAAREFTLLDYRKKTTADLVAAYVMPFQFWYSRSYKNWMQRIVDRPGMVVAYIQYRHALEKIHSEMPEWYRYQINLGHLIGLPEDNPLYFNLESMINPLNGLLGIDYNDSRRKKDAIPAAIDAIGKYGPSTHTLISWAIAASYAIRGDKDTAEAWAGRAIPLTKLVKDVTSTVGLNQTWNAGIARGTPGGIETDPIINWFYGGMEPHENKRIARKLAEMVQRGEISDEDAAQAAHDQTGDTWNLAWQYAQNDPNVPIYERRGFLSSLGGVFGTGLRGRTEQDIVNDKFYEEYALLRGIQNNLSPSEYKQKMVQLYERYPAGEYLVLAKKNDTFRDQAWAYSVLDRVKPGTLSGIAENAGLDRDLLDKFYEDKGRIDLWDESDRNKFLSAIRDISVVMEIPPESTQHDYNVARIRNMQLNEFMKQKYGSDIMDRINAMYDIDSTDTSARLRYLRDNPDVQQAIAERDSNILSDPILEKYYGGIDKLETYLQYEKRGRAAKKFGEGIYELISAYTYAQDNGYDTKAMREDYPQIEEYFNWNKTQEEAIQKTIDEWGTSHLPDSSNGIVNPNAAINSIGQENLAKYLTENNVDSGVETFLAPYMATRPESEYTSEFSQAKYIEEEAEKRWAGITDRIAEFEKAKAVDPALASQMWATDPTISMYYTYVRGIQSQSSQAEKGNFPADNMAQIVMDSMSPELYRLAVDKVNGYEINKSAEKQLSKLASKLGITYNQLLLYVLENTQ